MVYSWVGAVNMNALVSGRVFLPGTGGNGDLYSKNKYTGLKGVGGLDGLIGCGG